MHGHRRYILLPPMAEAYPRPLFMLLPFKVHMAIVKLLHLKVLVYAQLTPITESAVKYVFFHRKQLNFGSVWGSNGQIRLPDSTIIKILYSHDRAEVITDFSVQQSLNFLHLLPSRTTCDQHGSHCMKVVGFQLV